MFDVYKENLYDFNFLFLIIFSFIYDPCVSDILILLNIIYVYNI